MEPYHLETTELLRLQLGEHIGITVKAAVWVPPIESSDFGAARCAFNLIHLRLFRLFCLFRLL
jgi:hypothetical protein